MTRLLSPYGYKTIIRLRYLWACRLEEAVQYSCQETQCCEQTKETRGFAFYVLRLDIGVCHTDVNIKCYVKNVTKYVDITYSVTENIMDITCAVKFATIRLKCWGIHLLTTLQIKHWTQWILMIRVVTNGLCSKERPYLTTWWKNKIHSLMIIAIGEI